MMRASRNAATTHPRSATPVAALPALRAERLVGVGFRSWMAGLDNGDIECWQYAFDEFAGHIGIDSAKTLMPGLSNWVKAVRGCARRPIEIAPRGCARFCRDECLAIAMVAAGQHSVCPALKACAFALIGSADIGVAMGAAEEFADNLRRADQILSLDSICNAAAFVPPRNTLLS
jgi:hypothetical protein